MATVKITFTAPEAPANRSVASICAIFEPKNAYIDMEAYEGTVYDTNVDGFGEWEGFVGYLSKITNTPNILILFKAASRDGEVEFEEADPKQLEYLKEIGLALADYGFTVEIDSSSAVSEG